MRRGRAASDWKVSPSRGADLPLEERRQLRSADDWAARLPSSWWVYVEDFATPSAHLVFYRGDMMSVRLPMRGFGMGFPYRPPPIRHAGLHVVDPLGRLRRPAQAAPDLR
jgi:hypothetical protein